MATAGGLSFCKFSAAGVAFIHPLQKEINGGKYHAAKEFNKKYHIFLIFAGRRVPPLINLQSYFLHGIQAKDSYLAIHPAKFERVGQVVNYNGSIIIK